MVQWLVDYGGFTVLTAVLIVVGLVAVGVEAVRLVREIARWRRHRAVARELQDAHLSVTPSTLTVPDRRRPDVAAAEVPAVRNGEPRDPRAAKVLAFRLELERKGYYVDELQIRKRII